MWSTGNKSRGGAVRRKIWILNIVYPSLHRVNHCKVSTMFSQKVVSIISNNSSWVKSTIRKAIHSFRVCSGCKNILSLSALFVFLSERPAHNLVDTTRQFFGVSNFHSCASKRQKINKVLFVCAVSKRKYFSPKFPLLYLLHYK